MAGEFRRWGTDSAPYAGDDAVARYKRLIQEFERVLIHLDPESPRSGTDDTPERVARMWVDELVSGYKVDIPALFKTFESESTGMVVIDHIPFFSTCEHHLVPFVGHAHVGYLPNGKVVGLSKIARVVQAFARRLQIQERLTSQIADEIQKQLCPKGVIVILEAEHFCMTIRGVQAPGTKTKTSEVRGNFNDNLEGEKEEFMRLAFKNGRSN